MQLHTPCDIIHLYRKKPRCVNILAMYNEALQGAGLNQVKQQGQTSPFTFAEVKGG